MTRNRLVGEQPGESEADKVGDGLRALPARRGVQFGKHSVFDSHDSSFRNETTQLQANDTAAVPLSEFRMAVPRWRSW